ncbi:hypothetical protein SARC_15626 [Sphaeroforma arctica JP610]|uniref:Uncharacterized protein n=1 Tax=Sphaeroforma arctica JP610 TaxID=667725 RepID=A0A0L0F5H4_9EUKA|nr:hypothetical protein SARC_15626 [Sphaeroforma arctica JP610]KNC71831.1 hypothetical protein SARC_15626 [Sphaeroforma arctica JP610]|eukprot:XP_014145733.1 hypothetical protein SARC_15626 [Sphaeroforma arctica JP610]
MKLDTRTTAESDDLIGRESDVECKERTTDDRMEDKENTVNGHQRKRRTLEITMETDDYAQSTKRQRHIDTELQPNNGKANRDNYEEVDQRAKGSTDGEDEVHDGVSSRGRDDGGGYQGNAIHRRMSVIKQPSPRSEMCNQQ